MTMENSIGIQTRAMTEAQCIEDGAQRQLGNNPEQVQGANPVAATGQRTANPDIPDPVMNDDKVIEEFVR